MLPRMLQTSYEMRGVTSRLLQISVGTKQTACNPKRSKIPRLNNNTPPANFPAFKPCRNATFPKAAFEREGDLRHHRLPALSSGLFGWCVGRFLVLRNLQSETRVGGYKQTIWIYLVYLVGWLGWLGRRPRAS